MRKRSNYQYLRYIAFTMLSLFSVSLFAEEAEVVLSGANTSWILTATALVLFMTLPGLSLFYGGLVRSKKKVMLSLVTSRKYFLQVSVKTHSLVIFLKLYLQHFK